MIGPYKLDEIYTGDARELSKSIPDGCIDLIFTDPPYLKEYLPLYDWLGEEAHRILKPGGFLLAYAGTYWKAEVIRRLSQHMDYYFDFILLNAGNSPIMWQRKIISRHKSILAYRRPEDDKAHPRTNVISFWVGSGQDKRFHTWGQDESSARYYIDCFSKAGNIVFEPFAGGGTTPYVCKIINRRSVSFEWKAKQADIARARVAGARQYEFDKIMQMSLEQAEANL